MNKHEDFVNAPESNIEDERLSAVLKAAYPVGEASNALKQRVAALATQRSTPGVLHSLKMPVMLQRRFASAFIIFAALYLTLAYTYPGRSTKVFGQVEQAMQEVNTVNWISKRTITTGDGSVVRDDVDDVWVRLAPPAKSVHSRSLLPGVAATTIMSGLRGYEFQIEKLRQRPPISFSEPHDHESRIVTTPGGMSIYTVIGGKSTLTERIKLVTPSGHVRTAESLTEVLRSKFLTEILSPQAARKEMSDSNVSNLPPWKSERVTVAGQSLVRFYREYALHDEGITKQTIWADPLTHRIVRSELKATSTDGKRHYHDVNEQYRYDELSPKGTFDLMPPKGTIEDKIRR